GAIVAVYSLTNMVGNVLGGHWIDKYGRKKMLLTGMSLVSAILFLYPLAVTGWQLFIARFFHGLAGGLLIPAAFAYVGDNCKTEKTRKTMAYTVTRSGIAAIAGTVIGRAMAARSSIPNVLLLVAILFLITAILIVFFVQEYYVTTDRGKFNFKDFLPLLTH